MNKIHLLIVFTLVSITASAQNIGIGTNTPHTSALLEIKASDKGVLIPRTSTASRIAIVNPAKGLVLYDTVTSSFWFYSGGEWVQISNGGNGWSLNGNTGTNPATNFLGTTDINPLIFRVNNSKAGIIDSASFNTAIGFRTLDSITTGIHNSAFGYKALTSNTTGLNNTATGTLALNANTSGDNNTANGYQSLLSNTSGINNTASGVDALHSNTTGYFNTANGWRSLWSNTTGYENTANGYWSLINNTTGFNNTASGPGGLGSNTTGNYNTALGYAADVVSGGLTNATAIGANAKVGTSNTIQLGDASVTSVQTSGAINAYGYRCKPGAAGSFRGNVFNIDFTGAVAQLWIDVTNLGTISFTSDRRLKEDIDLMKDDAIARMMELNPVHFKYKKIEGTVFAGSPEQQEGFIADELEQVIPSAVNGEKNALTSKGTIQPQTINIVPVVAVLTKAVQEQQAIIEDQNKKIEWQQLQIENLLTEMKLIRDKIK